MKRPNFEDITSGHEFNQWYWLKSELVSICKESGLPYTGRKFELKDRIIFALDHNGEVLPAKKKAPPASQFNWARAPLSTDTIITDNVSFGPNFRYFMKLHIGPQFSCHADFMDWVKANTGKTLQDAIDMWVQLEERKKDPNFKRTIAPDNMYNQYMRDFLESHPDKSFKDAKEYWLLKKKLPSEDGVVRFSPSDISLTHPLK